jgi:hypothetical protein
MSGVQRFGGISAQGGEIQTRGRGDMERGREGERERGSMGDFGPWTIDLGPETWST